MARTNTTPTPIHIGADDDADLDGAVALSMPLAARMGAVGDGRAVTEAATGGTAIGGGGITLCLLVGGRDDCVTAFGGTAGDATGGGGAGGGGAGGGGAGGVALGGMCGGTNVRSGGEVGVGGGTVWRVLDEARVTLPATSGGIAGDIVTEDSGDGVGDAVLGDGDAGGGAGVCEASVANGMFCCALVGKGGDGGNTAGDGADATACGGSEDCGVSGADAVGATAFPHLAQKRAPSAIAFPHSLQYMSPPEASITSSTVSAPNQTRRRSETLITISLPKVDCKATRAIAPCAASQTISSHTQALARPARCPGVSFRAQPDPVIGHGVDDLPSMHEVR